MAYAMCDSISASYLSWLISPFLNAARLALISVVCGKEPIVVVGNKGKFNFACWIFWRILNTFSRFSLILIRSLMRFFTSILCTRNDCWRALIAAREIANSWLTESTPTFNAFVIMLNSESFSSANASQDLILASKLISCTNVTGVWSKEQLGASHRRSPSLCAHGANNASALSKSERQILRPSITPTDNTQ